MTGGGLRKGRRYRRCCRTGKNLTAKAALILEEGELWRPVSLTDTESAQVALKFQSPSNRGFFEDSTGGISTRAFSSVTDGGETPVGAIFRS